LSSLAPARPSIVRALGVALALTAAWGAVSGVTQYRFTAAGLLVAAILARTLTKAPISRSPLLPVLAAVLAFAVGFVGDFLAVALALWLHFDVPAAVISDHAGELFGNVANSHSAVDWILFVCTAIAAAALTASRQHSGGSFTRRAPASPDGGKEPTA
jgi:hypothetical protein